MKKRDNIFDGESYRAQFALIIYKFMMSRRPFTNTDVMKEFLGPKKAKEIDMNQCSITCMENYSELKKAFCDVRNEIRTKLGNAGCIEESGNNRNKHFRYVGSDDDPLADIKNAKVITDLKVYWQFCQDSAGFFPEAWLDYFFHLSKDLIDIKSKKKKGEQVMSASLDRKLAHIDLLPELYEHIKNREVLNVRYKPYDADEEMLVFHPQYLKEYNGRWFIFGHAEGLSPEYGYNIAIDRIIDKPTVSDARVDYQSAPKHFYDDFFKDIVGVSHTAGQDVKDVVIRAKTLYMYSLTSTKPIHPSQAIIKEFGVYEDGEYGEFSLHVEVNNELIGRILQMGDGLEVVSPGEVRQQFKERVKSLAALYD